jgi:hypothetical protein
MAELKKKESSFSILGRAVVNDYTFNMDQVSKNNKNYFFSSMNLNVSTGQGNEVFTSMMGGNDKVKEYPIYVHGKKEDGRDDFQNQFTVDWEDRFDEDILKTVGNMCFFTAALEKDENNKLVYKNFLHEYDFIAYVQKHLEHDMIVSVSGNLSYQPYEDKVSRKKEITKIIAKEDTKEEKFYAVAKQRVLIDADAIGKVDTDNNSIPITCYVADYLYKHEGQEIKKTILFKQTFDLPLEKFGEKKDKIIKAYFAPKKKNGTVWIGLVFDLIEGAESTLSSIDDLPEDLKESVELGLMDEKEALAKCTTGNKEKRLVFKSVVTQKIKDADDNETIVVMRDFEEYVVDDYVFLGDVFKSTKQDDSNNVKLPDIEDDELDDLLDDLDLDLDLDE